jgi:hypothetical protein
MKISSQSNIALLMDKLFGHLLSSMRCFWVRNGRNLSCGVWRELCGMKHWELGCAGVIGSGSGGGLGLL